MADANFVSIEADLCKGCGLCAETCPSHCLSTGDKLNPLGYRHARFEQRGCTACGLCFYVCPEPGAITVWQDEPVFPGTISREGRP